MEGKRGLFSRKFEPGALGKGTLHDIPLSTLHQVEGPVFPDVLPLLMCQMAPVHVPVPPLQSEFLLQIPAVSICPSSVLSAVTALAKPPLILRSNNGVPPATAHCAPLGF